MKKYLILLLLMTFALAINAQEQKKENVSKSETVQLMGREGILTRRDFYDIGYIGKVSFKTMVITDITTGEKTGALRLEAYQILTTNSPTFIGILDYDEISGCIKSLEYIKNNLLNTKPNNYTEFNFRTKDDVLIGALYSTDQEKWTLYIQTRDYISDSFRAIKTKEIDTLISLFTEAKNNLSAKLQ